MMIPGDNEPAARRVAEELELDEYFAEVLPDHKAERVAALREQDLTVAMEMADVALVRDDPRDVADMILLSRETRKKTVQNLFWATGYNAGAFYWPRGSWPLPELS